MGVLRASARALLDSLPGNIGTQDVEDCLKAIEVCCATQNVDRDKVAVVGGSHGGFLGAHLVARAPKLFKAAGHLRNPVTNLGAMVGSSDIPDWVACECASSGTPPGPDAPKKLFAMSPISGIDRVEAPVLLALGLKDRRPAAAVARPGVLPRRADTREGRGRAAADLS